MLRRSWGTRAQESGRGGEWPPAQSVQCGTRGDRLRGQVRRYGALR